MSKQYTVLTKFVANTAQFKQGLQSAANSIKETDSKVKSFTSSVGTGAVKAVGALTVAASTISGIVGKIGLGYNAMMEQSEIAWKTILGSQEKAKKTLEELQIMGAKTPFEFEGLDKAAKLLSMAKFEGKDLYTALTTVGDAVSAIGGNQETLEGVSMALFQMQAKGKVQAEEMLQLAERGLPVWDLLAEKMKKSPQQLMEMATKGELLAKDTVPLLVEALGDKFGGAMKEQSNTFEGMKSTIVDNIKIISGQLTEGFFNKVKNVMPTIIGYMDRFSSAFEEGGWRGVFEEFLPPSVVSFITTSINNIQSVITTLRDKILEHKDQIVATFEFYKNYWLGWFATIKSLFTGDGNIGQSFVRIIETIKTIALPILQDAMAFIMEQIAKVKQFWNENGAQIIQAVKNFVSVISSVFQFFAPALLFIIKSLWENVKGVISGAINIIIGLVKLFTGIFTGDWKLMGEALVQILKGALELLWNLFNLLMLGKLLGGIKAFIMGGLNLFKSFGTSALSTFKQFFNDILNWFNYFRQTGSSIWRAGFDTLKNVVQIFKGAVKGQFDNILSTTKSVFGKVKDAILHPIKTAKDQVKGFINDIKGFFSSMKLKFPKIKTPHFKLKNWSKNPVDWLRAMPSIDISWYAKGAVFTKPTLFNTPFGMKGFGEAGPEAALPLTDSVLGKIGLMIAKTMDKNFLSDKLLSLVDTLNPTAMVSALQKGLANSMPRYPELSMEGVSNQNNTNDNSIHITVENLHGTSKKDAETFGDYVVNELKKRGT